MNIRRITALLLSTWLLPATAATSQSQSLQPAENEVDMETMIVTANRIPQPRDQIGSAVSVIDRDQLDNRQSVFTADALQDLPGVAVNRTAGYGSLTQVRIRGAEANQVLVIIDGVEANDPALGDTFDFASLMSYDIDTVEVLRGPQSALWGSDATAGVINITTRTGAQGAAGSAFIEGGSFNTVFGGGNASFNNAHGGVNLNASWFDTDGFDATSAGDEEDGYDNLNLSLQTRWQPTDATRLKFFSRYTAGNSDYDGTDFTTGLPADADLRSDDKLLLLGTSGGITLFDDVWDQSLRLTYLDSDHQQSERGVETATSRADKIGVYYQSAFRLPAWSSFTDQHLVLAVDYEDENFKQRGSTFGAFDPNQDQGMRNTGYIAEFLTRPLPGLNLSASIRYDDNSEFKDITTYRFTGSYLFNKGTSRLHSSFGEGQKSPTFIERFGFYPGQFLGNPQLKPEQNTGFDIGIQQLLFSDRISVDLTWFSERLENEINGFAFDPDTGLFSADNLNGNSRRQGVEIELDGSLTETLTLAMSYTYTDSSQPDGNGGQERELRRPRRMASANLNQRLLNGAANVNLNVTYASAQRDIFFPPFPEEQQLVNLDSYVLVDLAGSYRVTPAIEVFARANNAFDNNYSNVFGYSAPGRAFYAGMRMEL